MATDDQRSDMRFDLAMTDTQLPDAVIDRCYVRATTLYVDNDAAIEAAASLFAIRNLLMDSTKLVDYTAAQSGEKLSQIFDHLFKARATFAMDLQNALANEVGAVWGKLNRKPTRLEEYPDEMFFPTIGSTDVSRNMPE